ncbi:MAG: glutathione S-transferase [Scytonematopsis contorta HA4267-MV1]|jgi:glutathione S-transferase|nr:glutathione S-transferase [Scytonematopsis contorta HA4267-MV1]
MDYYSTQKKPLRLITIPVSHYCEKARWALTKLKINFVEEAHTPPFHTFATNRVGGKLTPVLVTENGVFTDSTDILQYLDSIVSENVKLYPTNPELRKQAEELEELFDSQLGPATRRWGYSYATNDYKIMQRVWTKGIPFIERFVFPIVFYRMRSVVSKRFNITPENVASDYRTINNIFQQVRALLADGRPYLMGDNFSVADLTFAALAAPVIQPPEHPIKPFPLEKLSPQLASEISQFRSTPAGDFVLRLYRDERNCST